MLHNFRKLRITCHNLTILSYMIAISGPVPGQGKTGGTAGVDVYPELLISWCLQSIEMIF